MVGIDTCLSVLTLLFKVMSMSSVEAAPTFEVFAFEALFATEGRARDREVDVPDGSGSPADAVPEISCRTARTEEVMKES